MYKIKTSLLLRRLSSMLPPPPPFSLTAAPLLLGNPLKGPSSPRIYLLGVVKGTTRWQNHRTTIATFSPTHRKSRRIAEALMKPIRRGILPSGTHKYQFINTAPQRTASHDTCTDLPCLLSSFSLLPPSSPCLPSRLSYAQVYRQYLSVYILVFSYVSVPFV